MFKMVYPIVATPFPDVPLQFFAYGTTTHQIVPHIRGTLSVGTSTIEGCLTWTPSLKIWRMYFNVPGTFVDQNATLIITHRAVKAALAQAGVHFVQRSKGGDTLEYPQDDGDGNAQVCASCFCPYGTCTDASLTANLVNSETGIVEYTDNNVFIDSGTWSAAFFDIDASDAYFVQLQGDIIALQKFSDPTITVDPTC